MDIPFSENESLQTRGAILIHCLAGQGAFFIGDHQVELRPGVLISLPAAVLHSVIAAEREDLLLLLTISEQFATDQ